MADEDYVRMLRESLEKKIGVLTSIRQMDAEQASILKDQNSTPDAFEENLERKGALIDSINRLDQGFEQMYERVRETLQRDGREKYADEIRLMQNAIRQITDLSSAIQADEKKNRVLAEKKFANIREQAREIRKNQKAVSTYYKNMMKINEVDPQFLDSKK